MSVSVARRSAFEILRRVETESAFASILLAKLDANMREADRALCHELVLGVLRRKLWLDRVIEHFANRPCEKLDFSVRLALELGLYQLRFLTRVPPSAAVNESVNLVRAGREKSAAGFVNAVLRRATREPDYEPTSTVNDPTERLSIETSHPMWLVKRWIDALGFEEAAGFVRANNGTPPAAFRFTALAARDEVIDELESAGAKLLASNVSPQAWRVSAASSGRCASVASPYDDYHNKGRADKTLEWAEAVERAYYAGTMLEILPSPKPITQHYCPHGPEGRYCPYCA